MHRAPVCSRLGLAEAAVSAERAAPATTEGWRVVPWFEHDSYDQLILARCLAQFAVTPPRQLELISIGQFPGAARFIGLGQLPPEAPRLLWTGRQMVAAAQLQAGQTVWQALRAADSTGLATIAVAGIPAPPPLAAARRSGGNGSGSSASGPGRRSR